MNNNNNMDPWSTPSPGGSRGGSPQENEGPPPKKSKMLGEVLYNSLFTEPNTADLTVIIGPERSKVKGHKAVFAAMSEVFAVKLNSSIWSNCGEGEGEEEQFIEFPPDASEDCAKLFIKYLYTEELKADSLKEMEWVGILLELIYLADLFMVKGLKEMCNDTIISKMDTTNCVGIYQEAMRFGPITEVGKKAYEHLKRNVSEVIEAVKGSGGPHWEFETWKALLSEDYLLVEEIDLFRALFKWKKERVASSQDKDDETFQELIRLVRFPVMKVEDFAKYVAQSDALDKEDVIRIFVFLTLEGTIASDLPFSTESRRKKYISTADNLKACIHSSVSGDIIILQPGIYEGHFVLMEDGITIQGATNGRVTVKGCNHFPAFELLSSSCKLENILALSQFSEAIAIKGSHNIISSVRIGCRRHPEANNTIYAVHITGNANALENVTIAGYQCGIRLDGCNNILDEIHIHCGYIGIDVRFENNNLEGITLRECKTGIRIIGNDHVIKGLMYTYTDVSDESEIKAIEVTGSNHRIEQITCHGLLNNPNRYAVNILNDTEGVVVRGCFGGQVYLRGKDNDLTNVTTFSKLTVEGRGHKLEEVKSDVLRVEGATQASIVLRRCVLPPAEIFSRYF